MERHPSLTMPRACRGKLVVKTSKPDTAYASDGPRWPSQASTREEKEKGLKYTKVVWVARGEVLQAFKKTYPD